MLGLNVMSNDEPSDEHRVVNFRRGQAAARPPQAPDPAPVEDLTKYQSRETPEEYRDRMIVNVAAFAFLLVLVGAGFWLADSMARMRKSEDCVLSGRRNCNAIEVPIDRPTSQ